MLKKWHISKSQLLKHKANALILDDDSIKSRARISITCKFREILKILNTRVSRSMRMTENP